RAREASDGIEHALADLEAAKAPAEQLAPLRQQHADLQSQLVRGAGAAGDASRSGGPLTGADLPDLFRADIAKAGELQTQIAVARKDLATAESGLAKDALHRLDLRLSRLLRRARLGRLESVLGRKRALEVEGEAIRPGSLRLTLALRARLLPRTGRPGLDRFRYFWIGAPHWPAMPLPPHVSGGV